MDGFDFINENDILISVTSCKEQSCHENALPWIEKYRPRTVKDIISQDKITQSFGNSNNINIPHLLFHGPPGTGKTSTILAICRDLFGPELMAERVIELNASNDRGINSVRRKIKLYAMNAISDTTEYKIRTGNKYPCPSYKIIILDEADAMTKDAQSALRKIIESYSNTTRFCIICNYYSKIIEPIISRCVQYNFLPLKKEIMIDKLTFIAKNENISENIIKKIIRKAVGISDGDMRKAIMILQNFKYAFKTLDNVSNPINKFIEMNGLMTTKQLNKILTKIKTGTFDDNRKMINKIIRNGFAVDYFVEQFIELIINDDNLTDEMKKKICYHLSDNQKKIIDGANEYLQLMDIIMYTFMVVHGEM